MVSALACKQSNSKKCPVIMEALSTSMNMMTIISQLVAKQLVKLCALPELMFCSISNENVTCDS